MPDRPLINPATLAARLDIPVETLKKWRYLGKGPAFIKIEGHVRYSPDVIDEYLASRTS